MSIQKREGQRGSGEEGDGEKEQDQLALTGIGGEIGGGKSLSLKGTGHPGHREGQQNDNSMYPQSQIT